jgi:hypothetical protein
MNYSFLRVERVRSEKWKLVLGKVVQRVNKVGQVRSTKVWGRRGLASQESAFPKNIVSLFV